MLHQSKLINEKVPINAVSLIIAVGMTKDKRKANWGILNSIAAVVYHYPYTLRRDCANISRK